MIFVVHHRHHQICPVAVWMDIFTRSICSYDILLADLLTRSDGAMLFRSPPPGGLKKKKNRPEPLVIPPNVAAVQSRLRSPRIWDPPNDSHSVQHHTGRTPPPYTPPPILSPMRSGTGLFYGIMHRPSLGGLSASMPATKLSSQLRQQDSVPCDESVAIEQRQPEPVSEVIPAESTDVVAEEESIPPPPETDIQPHINIGTSHQASLPVVQSKFTHWFI